MARVRAAWRSCRSNSRRSAWKASPFAGSECLCGRRPVSTSEGERSTAARFADMAEFIAQPLSVHSSSIPVLLERDGEWEEASAASFHTE